MCYKTNFEDAHRRKVNKYKDLVEAGRSKVINTSTVTLQVSSQSFLNLDDFKCLFHASRVAAVKTDTAFYKM